MKRASLLSTASFALACLALAGCGKKFNPADGEVTPVQAVAAGNAALVTVDKPEQFPVVSADHIDQPDTLNVTGSVFPDVSREIPVVSMANGRVVDIRARLDDHVKKGQLLFSVESPDISNVFNAYRKAVADEQLANKALARANDLYQHNATSLSMLEQAEDAETDAQANLKAAEEQLKIFGVDKDHPSPIVNVYAPTAGVIVAQNITDAAVAGASLSGTATAFTIADLSSVWVLCDVYENDLPRVQLGQQASIQITAYPGKLLAGRVSDIGPVLDPTIRTAKVRIEVANPGILRLGMFVTATLSSRAKMTRAVVPATAILHLHDRDWVFVPAGQSQFKRVEVTAGDLLPGDRQVILSGLKPEDRVVKDVLNLEATAEAQ